MKVYGNLINRVEEGKNYSSDNLIHVGDDITMYHWSDRTCYYVTEVIDQKHIKVRQWNVCADQEKRKGPGHQDWLYFKTHKELVDYLSKYFDDYSYNGYEYPEEEWVYRYNRWKRKFIITPEDYKRRPGLYQGRQAEKLKQGISVPDYSDLSGKISFGKRDYYYDWEF